MGDRQARIDSVDKLCEEYYKAIREWPDSRQLKRLTDEILREELVSKKKNKASKPYSFLSNNQFKRRYNQEASFKFTEEYDTDGKFQGKPIRRYKKY